MNKIHFKLKRRRELKEQNKPIILKGWPEFFVAFFITVFIVQVSLLIFLNWNF
ncbi:MAG: hypothetical protein WC564_03420 [Patescibacteria group bacterium]